MSGGCTNQKAARLRLARACAGKLHQSFANSACGASSYMENINNEKSAKKSPMLSRLEETS
jgi:hypothetical protein